MALRSLLGAGRTANLRGITVRRLYGAEEMVDEQAKAFEDGKRAAAAEREEKDKAERQARAVASFVHNEVAVPSFRKRSLWAKYRTQIAPSMAEQLVDEDEDEEYDAYTRYSRDTMARKLQARRRGQTTRRDRGPEIEARRVAAIRMQGMQRGGMARRTRQRQNKAATAVESQYRGRRTRSQGLLLQGGLQGRPSLANVVRNAEPRYGFAQPIVLHNCLGGVGVGVDERNVITALRPGFPAQACGVIEVGDRVISIDGVRLAYKGQVWQLAQVMKRSNMHIFGVEQRLWELDEDGNIIDDDDDDGGGGDNGGEEDPAAAAAAVTSQVRVRVRVS